MWSRSKDGGKVVHFARPSGAKGAARGVAILTRLSVAPPFDKTVHQRRLRQRAGIAQIAELVLRDLPEDPPHDLAGAGLRQRGREVDQVRSRARADYLPHMLFEFRRQRSEERSVGKECDGTCG